MSGYLQRMAMSASRRERRVLPLVGGLYTKQPEQVMEESATTIVPRASDADVTSITARDTFPVPRGIREPSVRSAVDKPLAVSRLDKAREGRERHRMQRDAVSASQPEERGQPSASEVHGTAIPSAPDLLVARKQFIDGPERSQVSTETAGQTQIGDMSRRESEALEGGKPVPTSLSGLVSAADVRPSARTLTAQPNVASTVRTGGNDVQIHIGRIEVIAVPQQVASRPVSTPAQRGPSLEEYLQRRDRRSR